MMRCHVHHRLWLFPLMLICVTGRIGIAQSHSPGVFPHHQITNEMIPTKAATQPADCTTTEIQVELAWWSDPITFPYYLDAVSTSDELVLRGYVPNDTIRRRVVDLARRHARVKVHDSLQTYGRVISATPPIRPVAFRQDVTHALKGLLTGPQNGLRVYCGLDGRVAVSGTVTDWHEKWAISDALRRVPGCTSIDNRTSIRNVETLAATGTQNQPATNSPDNQPIPATAICPLRAISISPPKTTPIPIPVITTDEPIISPVVRAYEESTDIPDDVEPILVTVSMPEPIVTEEPGTETPSPSPAPMPIPLPRPTQPKLLEMLKTIELPDAPEFKKIDTPEAIAPSKTTAANDKADAVTVIDNVAPENLERMAKSMVVAVQSFDAVMSIVKQCTPPQRTQIARAKPLLPSIAPAKPTQLKAYSSCKSGVSTLPIGVKAKSAAIHAKATTKGKPRNADCSDDSKRKPATQYPASAKYKEQPEPLPAITIDDPIFIAEEQSDRSPTKPSGMPPTIKQMAPPTTKAKQLTAPAVSQKQRRPQEIRATSASSVYKSAVATYNPLYSDPNVNPAAHNTTPKKLPVASYAQPTYREVYLKKRIEAVADIRGVSLQFLESRKLQIRFSVKSRTDGVQIVERIRGMPELRQYHLHFQLQLQP